MSLDLSDVVDQKVEELVSLLRLFFSDTLLLRVVLLEGLIVVVVLPVLLLVLRGVQVLHVHLVLS